MKKSLAIFAVFVFFLSAVACAEEAPEEQRDRENDFIKELSYRQREYQSQYVYLSEKESRTAAELNDEITTQNQTPSAISLQRIDNLRTKLMELLQDQIKNDRDYIRYIEMRLSEMVDYKFPTIKAVQEFDKDTLPPVNAGAVILDQPSAAASPVQDERSSAVAAPKPEESNPAESASPVGIPPYKRERIPLTIEEDAAAPAAENEDARKFKESQAELDRLHDESLKPRSMQDY